MTMIENVATLKNEYCSNRSDFAATNKAVEDACFGYAKVLDCIRDYNRRVLRIAEVNSEAAFDHVQQLVGAKSASEILELCNAFACWQIEALTEQTKELAGLDEDVLLKEPFPGEIPTASSARMSDREVEDLLPQLLVA